jgi:hypothetical protein
VNGIPAGSKETPALGEVSLLADGFYFRLPIFDFRFLMRIPLGVDFNNRFDAGRGFYTIITTDYTD